MSYQDDDDEEEPGGGGIDLGGERGCGKRKAGGCYLVCGLSPYGTPINEFLIDPPKVLDYAALGIEPLGVTIITDPQTGISHVFDHVGSEHYLNVADFVEEAKRLGFSRRISSNTDFSKLSRESRVFLIHSRAMIHNGVDYQDWECPTRMQGAPHVSPFRMRMGETPDDAGVYPSDDLYDPPCAGIWWRDIEGGAGVPETTNLAIKRTTPCGAYLAHARPEGVTPDYEPALFMWFPLNAVQIVKSEDGSHLDSLEKAAKAKVLVTLEDE